jgi:hypothetical protein
LRRDPENAENKAAWQKVLGQPRHIFGSPSQLPVTIGLKGHPPLQSEARLPLRAISPWWMVAWIVTMAFLAAVLLVLGRFSNLLRDGELPSDGRLRCFSLARTQMAFWFFVTVGAYLFLLMLIKDPNTLSADILGLIGISAATGFGAILVDNSKRQALREKLANTRIQAAALRLATTTPTDPSSPERLRQLDDQISSLEEDLKVASTRGFWRDVLCDGSGVSFHRLQILVWTLIIGFIFAHSVYEQLAMPELSATLLGLMGLSGGTYVGFKIPEKLG